MVTLVGFHAPNSELGMRPPFEPSPKAATRASGCPGIGLEDLGRLRYSRNETITLEMTFRLAAEVRFALLE
jgi:hypothetical protein